MWIASSNLKRRKGWETWGQVCSKCYNRESRTVGGGGVAPGAGRLGSLIPVWPK